MDTPIPVVKHIEECLFCMLYEIELISIAYCSCIFELILCKKNFDLSKLWSSEWLLWFVTLGELPVCLSNFFFPPASHSPIGGGVVPEGEWSVWFFVDYELFDSSLQLGAISLRKIERNKEDGRQKIGDPSLYCLWQAILPSVTLLNCGTKWWNSRGLYS